MRSASLKRKARLVFRVVAVAIIAGYTILLITGTPTAGMIGYVAGRVTARLDTHLGRLKIISCVGVDPDCTGQFEREDVKVELEYDRILYDRYGIRHQRLCWRGMNPVLRPWIDGYVYGYASVLSRDIEKRYGLGIFKEVRRESLHRFGKIG